ncbi:coenzyme F420-0:L-glutamate ligase [Patescibacteria group bacterium]|nr:coenzyme F420-0:L-glutamate ligase [Patescibacteria group bacterium]
MELVPNPGKKLVIDIGSKLYARLPIKTHIITKSDNIVEICKHYAGPHLQPGDFLFVSERIVAISQGRAFPIKDIHPSPLARFLARFVQKSPYGIGLASPWTMELAIREVGIPKILLAALVSAATKPFGLKGIFYRVAGKNINAIDGPCSYTLPPYNEYAKLAPIDSITTAQALREDLGYEMVIIDANDLGVEVLGKSSHNITNDFCKQVFRDNPLGQSLEQTPLCIVRLAPFPH